MASVVGICNRAMRMIGASTITSLNQGTKNANFCNDVYADVRDELLESGNWNFAIKSVQLAQLATTPAVKFDYAYQLPADFIKGVSVYDSNEGLGIVDHQFRDGAIESVSSQAWMVYVSGVTDPNKMSPLFRRALASAIAVEAATGIAESLTLREQMEGRLKSDLRRARSMDAMSNLPDRMPVGSWVTGRTGRLAERRWSW